MMVLASAPAPKHGDQILIPMAKGARVAQVLGYDPATKSIEYALNYGDTKSLPTVSRVGYQAMDDETPVVWRQPKQKVRMRASFHAGGRQVEIERMAPTRPAMRMLALAAYGMTLLGVGYMHNRYIYEARTAILTQAGSSSFDPKLMKVTIV
jgi:hypothetical protein